MYIVQTINPVLKGLLQPRRLGLSHTSNLSSRVSEVLSDLEARFEREAVPEAKISARHLVSSVFNETNLDRFEMTCKKNIDLSISDEQVKTNNEICTLNALIAQNKFYSGCPKTEHSVWRTEQKSVQFEMVWFSSFGLYFFRSVARLDRFIYKKFMTPFIYITV